MTNSERLLTLLREREWRVLKIGDLQSDIRDLETDIAVLLSNLRCTGIPVVCATWSVLLDDDSLLIDDVMTADILDRIKPTQEDGESPSEPI